MNHPPPNTPAKAPAKAAPATTKESTPVPVIEKIIPSKAPVAPAKAEETSTDDSSVWSLAGLDALVPRHEDDLGVPVALWKNNVSTNAGQICIRRNENIWNKLHENNIDLGRLAEKADRNLREAISSANTHHKALKDLERSLEALPTLLQTIQRASKTTENLKSRMETLEFAFESIAKEKSQESCDRWRKQLSDSVMEYKESKEQELRKIEYRLRVEKQRADRAEEIHAYLQRLDEMKKQQEEREKKQQEYLDKQQSLQDAFAKQVEEYKTTGTISEPTAQTTTLEKYDLDVDASDLDSFLGASDEEAPVGLDPSLQEEPMPETEPVEVLPVIENPEAEYKRYLELEFENATQDHEEMEETTQAHESAESLVTLGGPTMVSTVTEVESSAASEESQQEELPVDTPSTTQEGEADEEEEDE